MVTLYTRVVMAGLTDEVIPAQRLEEIRKGALQILKEALSRSSKEKVHKLRGWSVLQTSASEVE